MTDYTSEQWAALTEILGEALERPVRERTAFLDRACEGNPDLRAEVGRLLAAHLEAEAGGRFQSGATDLLAQIFPDTDPIAEIGPYRLLSEIGRGGMGRVWLAERRDGVYEQQVAIKTMQAGVLSDGDRRRFEAERRILARLEHPNVARILDGGVAGDGQLYLVMEYVDGESITDYCARRRASLDERIELMRVVCDAVDYAHRKLVVHRDLKPSNIFVTRDGTVKLLDFGIAKLLSDDEAPAQPATVTGAVRMTPEYAAPEQVTGDPVTTATDVYSLGIVLFELLTGTRPYVIESRAPTAVAEVVCRAKPPKPSQAVRTVAEGEGNAAEKTARRLRGDLDTIVLRALSKEPERRYASAADLGDDLRRSVQGLPVRARPDTTIYRARKFVGRHRAGVAATMVVAIALVSALVVSIEQTRTATAEREKAEAVNHFLVELLAAADPREQGRDVRVASLLDQAGPTLEARFAGKPALEAQVRHTLGVTYRELGLLDEAEDHLLRSLDLRERLHRRGHRDLLMSLNALGTVLLARGRHEEADALLSRALEDARAAQNATAPIVRDILSSLGYVRYRLGDLESSLALHSEAISVSEAQPEPNPVEVAAGLGNVAIVLADLGRLDEAAPLMERQLEIYREHFASDNTRIARALTNLASVYIDLGRMDDAATTAGEGVDLFRRALGEEHPDLAWGLGTLGNAQFQRGDPEALVTLRASLDAYERAFGPEHPRTASALLRLGQAHLRAGDHAQARELLLRGRSIATAAGFDDSHPLQVRLAGAIAQLPTP